MDSMEFGIGDWKRPLVLAWLELPVGERHLPLSVLARRYPPPRVETLALASLPPRRSRGPPNLRRKQRLK